MLIPQNLKKVAVSLLIATGVGFSAAPVYADAARGMEIAQERKLRDEGWGTSFSEVEMTLTNSQGESSSRKLRTKTLEVKDDGDKSLTIFDEPRDVSGTAFLTHSHSVGPDDQWLYLPALKRVKRISSRNKSGPFMGSEFSYEDLSSFELEKYQFEYLGDEEFEGTQAYKVKQIPKDENSGYTQVLVWLDQQEYRPLKIDFYDRKGDRLKTLTFTDYEQHLGKYWRANKMSMVNHQTGKSTTLTNTEMSFGEDFEERDFNKNALKRQK